MEERPTCVHRSGRERRGRNCFDAKLPTFSHMNQTNRESAPRKRGKDYHLTLCENIKHPAIASEATLAVRHLFLRRMCQVNQYIRGLGAVHLVWSLGYSKLIRRKWGLHWVSIERMLKAWRRPRLSFLESVAVSEVQEAKLRSIGARGKLTNSSPLRAQGKNSNRQLLYIIVMLHIHRSVN